MKNIPKDLLEKYLDEGKLLKELSKIFDCDTKTIRNYTKRYGLKNKNKNILLDHRDNIKVDDIRRLVEYNGMKIGQVAELYEVDKDAMSAYCLRHKIKYERYPRFDTSKFDINHIQSMIDANMDIIDISEYYECSAKVIARWGRKNIKDFDKYTQNKLYFINPKDIKEMLHNKIKKDEIASVYNCSPETINRFCRRYNIDYRRLLHVQYRLNAKKIQELFDDGFGITHIAKYYKCSTNAIRSFCENNNIEYIKYIHSRPMNRDSSKMKPPSIRDIIPLEEGYSDTKRYIHYKSKIGPRLKR